MKVILIISILYAYVYSIAVGVDGKSERCFQFDVQPDQTIKIPFVVSGINEDQVGVELFRKIPAEGKKLNDETIVAKLNYKEGQITHESKQEEELNICFVVLDSYYKYVSFDIDISGIDKNYAGSDDMNNVEIQLRKVFHKMQRLYRNQHFQMDRESVHQELMESTEKKVKACALSKIIVLIVVCLVQVYMLTNFFKDKSFGPSV